MSRKMPFALVALLVATILILVSSPVPIGAWQSEPGNIPGGSSPEDPDIIDRVGPRHGVSVDGGDSALTGHRCFVSFGPGFFMFAAPSGRFAVINGVPIFMRARSAVSMRESTMLR